LLRTLPPECQDFCTAGQLTCVPRVIEAACFDYYAIDHEHEAFDMETIANPTSWFLATKVRALVRIHKSFAHLIPGILIWAKGVVY